MRHLLALALLLAAAFYFLRANEEGEGAGPARTVTPTAQEAVAPRASAELAKEASATEEPTSIERAVVETSALEAVDTAAPAAAPVRSLHVPTGPTRELFVFHGDTGAPAAGVEVLQLEPGVGTYLGLEGHVRRVLVEGAARLDGVLADRVASLRAYRTDAQGRVQVEDTAAGSLVCARVGDKEAWTVVGGSWDSGIELELRTPHGVLLRTVDPAGNPVGGVKVRVAGLAPVLEHSLETSASGELRLHSLDTLLQIVLEPARLASREQFRIRPEGLEPLVPEAEGGLRAWFESKLDDGLKSDAFDPALARDQTVELVVGACELEVTLLRPDGQAFYEQGARVALGEASFWGATEHPLMDGTVRFVGLPVGTEQEVRALALGGTLLASRTVVTTPGVQEVRLVIEAGGALKVRFVGPAGQPLALERLRVAETFRSAGRGGAGGQHQLEPDADGVAEWKSITASRGLEDGDTLTLDFRADLDGQEWLAPPFVLKGPRTWPHDMGKVTLSASQPFVAGRVVDADGAPLTYAMLEIEALVDGDWIRSWAESGMSMDEMSDSDGRFTIHRLALDEEYAAAEAWRIKADLFESGRSAPFAFAPGDTDVELVFAPPGALEASVHPEDVGLGVGVFLGVRATLPELRADVEPETDLSMRSLATGWHYVELEDHPRVVWKGLLPGDYDVRLVNDFAGEPLAEWRGVRVEAGELTRDPRLAELRLSAWSSRAELVVRTELERPPNTAWYRKESAPSSTLVVLDPTGRAEIFGPPGEVLVIGSQGYLATSAVMAPGLLEVRLETSPWIELALPAGLAVPETVELSVALWPKAWDDAQDFGRFERADFQGGLARVRPAAAGPQTVYLTIRGQRADGANVSSMRVLDQAIDPSNADGPIELVLTAADLAL